MTATQLDCGSLKYNQRTREADVALTDNFLTLDHDMRIGAINDWIRALKIIRFGMMEQWRVDRQAAKNAKEAKRD